MGKISCRGSFLLVALVLFATPSLYAKRGNDPQVQPPTENNLLDCNQKAQAKIKKLQSTYKDFAFTCSKRFLQKFSIPVAPKLVKISPAEFVNANWELFLSSAPNPELEFRNGAQYYKGIYISDRFARESISLLNNKEIRVFSFAIEDTSAWHISPTPRLSCTAVADILRKESNPNPFRKCWDYICNNGQEPLIAVDFCPDSPTIVWTLGERQSAECSLIKVVENTNKLYYVDSNTGRVCKTQKIRMSFAGE